MGTLTGPEPLSTDRQDDDAGIRNQPERNPHPNPGAAPRPVYRGVLTVRPLSILVVDNWCGCGQLGWVSVLAGPQDQLDAVRVAE
jgi:hypothetical protein